MKLFTNLSNLSKLIYENEVGVIRHLYRKNVLYQGYEVIKKKNSTLGEISESIRKFPLSGAYEDEHLDVKVIGTYENNNMYAIFYHKKNRKIVDEFYMDKGILAPIEDDEELPQHRDSKKMYVIVHDNGESEIKWYKYSISVIHRLINGRYQESIFVSGIEHMYIESQEWDGLVKDTDEYGNEYTSEECSERSGSDYSEEDSDSD